MRSFRPRAPRRSSLRTHLSHALSALTLVVALGGCSTLYSRTIDRGDQAAALGRWDDAAVFYQRAADLEPDEREAKEKLKNARRHQAAERVKLGRAALANGKPRDALKPLSEATKLDPSSADAKQAFAEARAAVVAEAKKELQAGNLRQALLVAREVLALLPEDAEALDIEGQARTKLAEQAVAKAQEFEKAGNLTSAMMQYAEALVMRPDNSTARSRLPDLKQPVRDRVTFNVALGTFDGDTRADDLGSDVGPSDIARGIDATYLIRVSDKPPTKASYTLNGMRLGGQFRGYIYKRDSERSTRSCDYICGTELVANPEYGRAQADMNAKQLEYANAQSQEQMASQRIQPAENAANTARQNESSAQSARDAASMALSQCRSSSPDPNVCSALQAGLDQAEARYQQAQAERQRAEADLSDARSALSEASSRRSQAEMDSRSATDHFNGTPPQITVDKHCNHDYSVDTVSVRGDVELVLKGESLYDTTPVMNQTVNGHFDAHDETYRAERGFCVEIVNGDPLDLPAEGSVKKKVVESAVSHGQGAVINAYETYRKDYLTRARAAEADRKEADAADLYIRFLVTATKMGADEQDARSKVSGFVGVTPEAIDLALAR
jgi:tetratricopeptide (TPR) repeat protein